MQRLIGIALLLLSCSKSYAYFTIGESAEIIKLGTFDLGFEPQIMLSGYSGVNASVLGDYALTDESSVRAHLGTGTINFDAGVSYKWVPVPDYKNQPAIGGKVEFEAATNNGTTTNAVRFEPIVSKRMNIDYGEIVPFGALALNLMNTGGNGITALQLVGGSEFHHPRIRDWTFEAELGINLSNASSYISGLATYHFNQDSRSRR